MPCYSRCLASPRHKTENRITQHHPTLFCQTIFDSSTRGHDPRSMYHSLVTPTKVLRTKKCHRYLQDRWHSAKHDSSAARAGHAHLHSTTTQAKSRRLNKRNWCNRPTNRQHLWRASAQCKGVEACAFSLLPDTRTSVHSWVIFNQAC